MTMDAKPHTTATPATPAAGPSGSATATAHAKPGPSHWLDEPRNVKRLWRGFLVVLALTVLAELLVPLHPHFEIESVFGFSAWFGFMACAAMIVVAKGLALLLKRPDNHYGGRHD